MPPQIIGRGTDAVRGADRQARRNDATFVHPRHRGGRRGGRTRSIARALRSLLGARAGASRRSRVRRRSTRSGRRPPTASRSPSGFRADVLISWGDEFARHAGQRLRVRLQQRLPRLLPAQGEQRGTPVREPRVPGAVLPARLQAGRRRSRGGQDARGGRDRAQVGRQRDPARAAATATASGGVVSPVEVQHARLRRRGRRARGRSARCFSVTGPVASDPRVGSKIWGSVGNCSGGITPWGTAISCEENFDGYGLPLTLDVDFANGWYDEGGHDDYLPGAPYRADPPGFAKYGWVCEHDPYDPHSRPRKHTALGRFRHENTAYRQVRRGKFVIYMGDDRNNDGIYKFVSDRSYHPRDRRTT